MSCGVGHRSGLDMVLLWLWRRPVATAPIRPLAWDPPYAGAAQKNGNKTKKIYYISKQVTEGFVLLFELLGAERDKI